jgi:MarR family 2-MHQ and catechol resistance regulon transcriptional repressor
MEEYRYSSNLTIDEKVLIGMLRAAEFFKREHSAQYNVLRVLDASQNGQNTLTRVGSIMLVSGANITGIAKRLEKGGFLIRRKLPNDERVTVIEITPKGRQALKNADKEENESLKTILGEFSEEDKNEMVEKIKKILKHRR